MLEYLVEASISHAIGGKDIAGGVAEDLLDVVILKINEFLILHSAFRDLSVEEGSERSRDA